VLILVIPCHNEAASVGEVARRAAAFGKVLVVDDRSSDESAAVARAAGAEVLTSERPGYDGALQTGLKAALAAGAERVVTLDADGEHDPAVIPRFDAALAAGAEVVCGYRPKVQRWAEGVAAAVARPTLGVRDPLCGMKGYARPAIARYLASGAPLHVNMTPMVLARRAGGRLAEVAVSGQARAGAPRFGRALRANLTILRAFAGAMSLKGANS
jgi:glycosyltransferase involved in cell wall biosynthesis